LSALDAELDPRTNESVNTVDMLTCSGLVGLKAKHLEDQPRAELDCRVAVTLDLDGRQSNAERQR
jgi:hypothetical protein